MRSEAWRPAAAARNRSPREVRDPARQALRPGCEELAVRLLCNAGDGSAAPAPKTATVERREASVPRHGKCSLHSTLYDSTAVWIIPRSIVLLQHSAVLRSMVLHSYIPDTDRTLEAPDPCPNHAMPSSKVP